MKKLSTYAEEEQIQYRTAWNRYKQGKIPGAIKDEHNHIWVPDTHDNLKNQAIIYARVSTPEQQEALDHQATRLRNFAISRGYEVTQIIKEIGSGVDDNRAQLNQIFQSQDTWGVLIIENKDRLTRVGYGYVEKLLNLNHKTILVADTSEDSEEGRTQDIFSMLYSFVANEYGRREAKSRAMRAAKVLEAEENSFSND